MATGWINETTVRIDFSYANRLSNAANVFIPPRVTKELSRCQDCSQADRIGQRTAELGPVVSQPSEVFQTANTVHKRTTAYRPGQFALAGRANNGPRIALLIKFCSASWQKIVILQGNDSAP